MSSFVIFAIVLTIIYIIYYAVMVFRELYGKKEQHFSNQETFDVSDMERDVATQVNETGNGFSFTNRDTELDTSIENKESNSVETIASNISPCNDKQEDDEVNEAVDKTIVTVYNSMEQIRPEHSVELERAEFRMALIGSTNKNLSDLLKTQRDEL